MITEHWLQRRDSRLLALAAKRGPFMFDDRIYESLVVVTDHFIPCRDEQEAKRVLGDE